jgi:hypothetical protein
LLSAAITAGAWAQSSQSDYHTTQDPNRQIYLDSAFAHGHRHGYEEGFHAGDEDYQFRRAGSLPKSPRVKGYRSSFGDRNSYNAGFENGFRAGYADSYSGRIFHPAESAALAPAALVVSQPAPMKDSAHDFDRGVGEGYFAGFANKDNIADEPGALESAAWRCKQETHGDTYCNGFGTGYVMGRADSQSLALIQKKQTPTLAKNSSR